LNFKKIILYKEPAISEINIEKLIDFLEYNFPFEVEIKDNIFKEFSLKDIKKISSIRITDIKNSFSKHRSSDIEIEFEGKLCKNSSVMNSTTKVENAQEISQVFMYDGFELQKILRYLNDNKETLHIILTNRLTCTFDENDGRYHARAVICANPAIISTTGIIEAPAKPKEYYFEIMELESQGLDIRSAKEKYKEEFLEYNDKRLTKIIEGYILQVIFYNITGEAFCENIECRLNNAHWQKDLLFSQLEINKLCKKHNEILTGLN
jgi:hypothetical protein